MGPFVTLEGGEGAGKSTLIATLARRLVESGREVVVTREPGGSPLAERLRGLLLSGAFRAAGPEVEAVVFAAARSDHLSKTVVPALERGAVVLCDRFVDSTRVYQGNAGDVPLALLEELAREAVGARMPDLTLVLDVPASIGASRAAARRGTAVVDRFEGEGASFHEKVREGFLDVARSAPERCRVLDATRSPELVADEAWALLSDLLPPAPRR